ncbi:MAG: amino acid permease, partial [Deltaproteobacteria bacterium]
MLEGLQADDGPKMRRALGAWDVTLLGVGAIIGAGIFTTIGTAAAGDALRVGAGPSLMLSFLVTAVTCGFTAMCYAELAAMVPVSGSAYTYTYAAFGEVLAWVIGWDLMLEYAISNVAVAVSWANYFRVFLKGIGIDVPLYLAIDYRTAKTIPGLIEQAPTLFGLPIVLNVLAFSITAALTVLLVYGVRESARFNAVMVVVKILVLLLFVGAALSLVPHQTVVENWTPFFPNGWRGTFTGAAIVFFAYIGFDTVSTVAEETHNPGRTLPLGILGSLGACTLLYVVVAGVFCGIVSQAHMQDNLVEVQGEPLTLALRLIAPNKTWITTAVALGAVAAQTVTLLVYQMGQPRIFFSMARDGLLPPLFARIHPKYRTPHVTTVLTGALVAVASTFISIEELIDLTNIGTLFAFGMVCLGIPILRRVNPTQPRPFRVPFGAYALPFIGAAACIFLMFYLPSTSWWRFFGWLSLGLWVYALYGYHHSHLGRVGGRRQRASARTQLCRVALACTTVGLFWVPHDSGLLDLWRLSGDASGQTAIGLGLFALGCVGIAVAGTGTPQPIA